MKVMLFNLKSFLGNAGIIAGAIIGTLIGLALLIGAIIAVVILFLKFKPSKKYKYTPPAKSNQSTHGNTVSTSYKLAGSESASNSPSVNVVQPRGYKPSYPAPSAPPRYVGNSHRVVDAPSKPPSRPVPPKSTGQSPKPPSRPSPPVSTSYRPPGVKLAPAVSRKPPPPTAQKPQGKLINLSLLLDPLVGSLYCECVYRVHCVLTTKYFGHETPDRMPFIKY